MRIAVLIKQVIDPESPASTFRVDKTGLAPAHYPGVSQVMSPYDEQAVEAALRLRETADADVIVAISFGGRGVLTVLRTALAMGADEALHIADEAAPNAGPWRTATLLAMALERMGPFDLILCGRQAADTDAGVIGLWVAALLGIPAVTFAKDVSVVNGDLRVVRVLSDGLETVAVASPALATVSHEIGTPRKPSLKAVRAARDKPMTIWEAAELAAVPSEERVQRRRLYVPPREGVCEMIEGKSAADKAVALARRLHEAGLV